MNRTNTPQKTLAIILATSMLASLNAGAADRAYNSTQHNKMMITTLNTKGAEHARAELILSLRSGGSQNSGAPNSGAMLDEIRRYCDNSTRTLGLARQSAEEAAMDSLQTPGPILADGISDALKEVAAVGKVNFHYVVALRAADKIAKSFMRSTQEEIGSVGADLTGKNRYVFLSNLTDAVIEANLELDMRHLFPFYSACQIGTPVVVVPVYPAPIPQHPSAIPQQALHQYPPHGGGYYPPNYCGVSPEYFFGLGKLALKIMELSSKNGQHPSYSKVEIQLELARSIIAGTIDVLLYSDLNRYYAGVINALDVLDARVEKMLAPGGMAEKNPSRAIAITFSEFDAIKAQLTRQVSR